MVECVEVQRMFCEHFRQIQVTDENGGDKILMLSDNYCSLFANIFREALLTVDDYCLV